jgi:hypothetical protein
MKLLSEISLAFSASIVSTFEEEVHHCITKVRSKNVTMRRLAPPHFIILRQVLHKIIRESHASHDVSRLVSGRSINPSSQSEAPGPPTSQIVYFLNSGEIEEGSQK